MVFWSDLFTAIRASILTAVYLFFKSAPRSFFKSRNLLSFLAGINSTDMDCHEIWENTFLIPCLSSSSHQAQHLIHPKHLIFWYNICKTGDIPIKLNCKLIHVYISMLVFAK